jgi:hypothetical protein
MELVNKELSKEASAKVELIEGKIVIKSSLDTAGVDAIAQVVVDGDYFFDKLKEIIPGQIDDAVIELFKAAVKAVK